jgi:DNA polymerase-3 subunit gamma/tau
MAYEVTATRKRPQVFDSLVGQQFVVSTIKNSIEQGRIAHAYLFSGPRGVGKTSSARILAKALNCIEGPTPYPCGVCEHCKEITQGNAPDVIEIDGASNTSVNDVRVIKDEVLFPPQSCRYKVYIIDEVHMLSASAFNALLKTIEEPPEYVIFIFATTETQKVPATIRSRCQQFHFQLIPLQIIKEVLVKTAQEMAVNAEDEALFWIAKEATGSMRDAYTLFDQVVSFSNGNITMQQIQDKLGLAGVDTLSSLFLAIWEDQPQQALSLLHTLLDAGVSIEQCIKDIAEYIRTLLLIGRSVTQEAILGIQMNRIPHVLHTAYSDEQLEAALDLFLRLYRDIRYSVNPRFELELAVSRLSRLKYLTSSVTLVEKMQQLKEELMSGSVTVTTAPKQQIQPKTLPKPEKQTIVEKEVPKPQQPVAPIKMELKPITRERLPEIIQQVAAERDPVGIILSQVVDVYQDETHLTFVFASAYALQNAKQNEQKLQHLILRLSGYDGPIQYILEEKEKKEELKPISDEVAQTIATVFRGEIVQNR